MNKSQDSEERPHKDFFLGACTSYFCKAQVWPYGVGMPFYAIRVFLELHFIAICET